MDTSAPFYVALTFFACLCQSAKSESVVRDGTRFLYATCSMLYLIEKWVPSHIPVPSYAILRGDAITTFDKCPDAIQQFLLKVFMKEWLPTTSTLDDCRKLVHSQFKGGRNLFVYLTNGELLGCVGIIEGIFLVAPQACNLYVRPEFRKQCYARRLMQFIDEEAHRRGYRILHGWCEEAKIGYYATMGWSLETSRPATILKGLWARCQSS